MATVSAHRPSHTVSGIMTLVQGGILVAFGLSVALASSYVSDMKFVFGPIDPGDFHELRVALGDAAVVLGIASVVIGLVALRGKKTMWLSNVIITSLAVAVVLAIHDIMQQPFATLLLPLAVSGVLLANLTRQRHQHTEL